MYTSSDSEKSFKIRNAAIKLFYENGIENTSIQEIANQAGIAKGTIYLYFNNRESLVEHVFEHCFRMHMDASMKDVTNFKSSSDKLAKRVKNIMIWNMEFPEESSVISSYYMPVNVTGAEAVAFSRSYEANKDFILEGVKTGELKQLPIQFLCQVFFSAVEGLSNYLNKNPQVLKDEKLLDKMIDATIDCVRI